MKIAAIQMVSGTALDANLARARALLEQARAAGAELAALPEYFCLMGEREDAKLACAETPGQGPIQAMLAAAARELGLWVVGGTLPLVADAPGHVRNTCFVYAPDGAAAARYDKIHLFRFDNGREQYDEGRVIEAGAAPVGCTAAGLRVGLSVCYDLRFPELYRSLGAAAPCDLISVPAAFTYTTGEKHWELLLRARAVENQSYVIAAAQGGRHANGRRTWGHSMIVDPWGEVLACQAEGEGVVVAELDPARLAQVRRQLPALAHRVL
ncbi:MAG: carbon-nitrogen hydrolase family protein [Pelomonas sp.]|nr:carbon-nitrogen hydrolase family protein [Roseateles sp.]